ncbi:MAG: hypothetical protein IJ316_00280 [Clostridia bacterium]|nr:hypothetical protein [Clostridia bacterium]
MSKKILSVILTLVMCLSLVASLNVTVNAAGDIVIDLNDYGEWPSVSKKKPIKCYANTNSNIPVYKTKDSENGDYGTVYGKSDELKILDITSDPWRIKVAYPTAKGEKVGWIDACYIASKRSSSICEILVGHVEDRYKATKKITTYNKKGGATYGYISKGDEVIVVQTAGKWQQVIYPVSKGYKLAWIRK